MCCDDYWFDIAFFIIKGIDCCVPDQYNCLKCCPASIKLLLRVLIGFAMDITGLYLASKNYGFDFHENGNLLNWKFICALIFVIVWTVFTVACFVLSIQAVDNEEESKPECLFIFVVSKVIGMINSGVILYVTILYKSRHKPENLEPVSLFSATGLESFFIAYAVIDIFLNLVEVIFELTKFFCCNY